MTMTIATAFVLMACVASASAVRSLGDPSDASSGSENSIQRSPVEGLTQFSSRDKKVVDHENHHIKNVVDFTQDPKVLPSGVAFTRRLRKPEARPRFAKPATPEEKKKCPAGCEAGGHGVCHEGLCFCKPGYRGESCQQKTCLPACSHNGECRDGKCVCDRGYGGPACGALKCPKNCGGEMRGRCVVDQKHPDKAPTCFCRPGYKGIDCSMLLCPIGSENNFECSDHGQCVNGTCKCKLGFTGDACQKGTCSGRCMNGATCVDMKCKCAKGFRGESCEFKSCPMNCSNHGSCTPSGGCICDDGFKGRDCSLKGCPGPEGGCSDHGHCNRNGTCVCDPGWYGEKCDSLPCPQRCNVDKKQGKCEFDKCVCAQGWEGDACEKKVVAQGSDGTPCSEDCFDKCRESAECYDPSKMPPAFWTLVKGKNGKMTKKDVPVSPGTGHQDGNMPGEQEADGDDMQGELDEHEKCFHNCVSQCMGKCYQMLHALPQDERHSDETGNMNPDITGNIVNDLQNEAATKKHHGQATATSVTGVVNLQKHYLQYGEGGKQTGELGNLDLRGVNRTILQGHAYPNEDGTEVMDRSALSQVTLEDPKPTESAMERNATASAEPVEEEAADASQDEESSASGASGATGAEVA